MGPLEVVLVVLIGIFSINVIAVLAGWRWLISYRTKLLDIAFALNELYLVYQEKLKLEDEVELNPIVREIEAKFKDVMPRN